ncbi:putative tumor necrosis factor receptor superfamily member 16 [Apostichopus japonicus]|uniref:Putative tumor necrosis factor receptor superfamily member 16 n=1 Tax=Stichopus japonicus TaxID=307972 RepID=A0A2G8KX84_STIJA|nr:putative tumor necrosis factor receptor superfamily member 16 [Apostichopus japonicus]
MGLFRKNGGVCSQCSVCPPGFGTIQPCTFLEDIICEECVPLKTYSDVVTRATVCKPCTRCRRGTFIVENCTKYSDTVCSPPPSSGVSLTPPSDPTGHPYHPGVSIVPLYCVLLAALVVGLLIYVLFKRWSFHQIKLRASQKMVRSNTSSTDIEKNPENLNGSQVLTATTYTGPSSYVVATVSPSTDVSPTTLYKELHSDKKVELEEKLMISRKDGRDWRALCTQLNFTNMDKEDFSKSKDGHVNPVHQMFHKWQSRDENHGNSERS